jgi:hypothetical protein
MFWTRCQLGGWHDKREYRIEPLVQIVCALAAVLAFAHLGVGKWLKAWHARQLSGARIRVVEQLSLDTKIKLHIVKIDHQEFWLASSERGVVLLNRMPKNVSSEENCSIHSSNRFQ